MVNAKEGDELTVPPVEAKPTLFDVKDSMDYTMSYDGETMDVTCNKESRTDADIACMFRVFNILTNLENLSKNPDHKKRFTKDNRTKITGARYVVNKILKEMVGTEIRKRLTPVKEPSVEPVVEPTV